MQLKVKTRELSPDSRPPGCWRCPPPQQDTPAGARCSGCALKFAWMKTACSFAEGNGHSTDVRTTRKNALLPCSHLDFESAGIARNWRIQGQFPILSLDTDWEVSSFLRELLGDPLIARMVKHIQPYYTLSCLIGHIHCWPLLGTPCSRRMATSWRSPDTCPRIPSHSSRAASTTSLPCAVWATCDQ